MKKMYVRQKKYVSLNVKLKVTAYSNKLHIEGIEKMYVRQKEYVSLNVKLKVTAYSNYM